MEGLRAALAASIGLHVAVVAAVSIVPDGREAPPPATSIVIPVEIVAAGAQHAAADEADPADPGSPPAGAGSVEPMRARPVAGEEAAAKSGGTTSRERQAVRAPPLPVPKPDRPPPRPERAAEALAPPKASVEPRASQRAGRVETEPGPEPPLSEERQQPLSGGGRDETAGSGAVVGLISTAEEGGPAATADGPAGAAPSDVLEAYFSRLQQWLEKHKRYPRTAQVRGQEGTGMLRFTVDRSGRVLSHQLDPGTGHAALDREIEAMIERAQPLPPIPQGLAQPALDLAIPVRFRLR